MSSHTRPGEVLETTSEIQENSWLTSGTTAENEKAPTSKLDGAREAEPGLVFTKELQEVRELQHGGLMEHSDELSSVDVPQQQDEPRHDDAENASSQQKEVLTTQDPMESSTATLKPPAPSSNQESNQSVAYDYSYLDPKPKPPELFLQPSRSASRAISTHHRSSSHSDGGFDEGQSVSDDDPEFGPRSEIQTIMDQFDEEGGGPGVDEVMSPRLQYAGSLLSSPMHHPPRKSSLEHLNAEETRIVQSIEAVSISSGGTSAKEADSSSDTGPAVPPKPNSSYSGTTAGSVAGETPVSPKPTLHRPPPPEPESDLPFDFHRFLTQLQHRTADPVAKYTRSFLLEFRKKPWAVHEQVKIIGDFLTFITGKMNQCAVWNDLSDTEFDNAREGIEKLIMNQLYSLTFSPAIQPSPESRGSGKGVERYDRGRKGQHQEDVERDEILAQKISIYGWVREEHLDIPPISPDGKHFLLLAQQELLKIKNYRAPRDKIICVLNCCKVIFGLLKHSNADASADSFIPLLIYVVLQANPEHLVSNVQYILRFRNQDKLSGEAGYYLSSLLGAIQFIENLGRTTLTISDKEFEENVEAAVSAIAEKHQAEEPHSNPPVKLSEKAAPSRPEVVRQSMEAEPSTPRRSTSSYDSSSDGPDDRAISGLLRSIQRPLSTIGRIFSDSDHGASSSSHNAARTAASGNTTRAASPYREKQSMDAPNVPQLPVTAGGNAEVAAARQASAETYQAQKLHRAEHNSIVETLAGMFPDLDRELISDVVREKEGRVGLAVDACLALSS